MAVLVGIHPVLEALRAGRPLDTVVIAKGAGGPRLQEIIDLCRASSIPVRFEERRALHRFAGGSAHQGVVALAAAHRYAALEDVIERALSGAPSGSPKWSPRRLPARSSTCR
jgi:23S rRNA (guanosine2251-2'-O)-methyltransferase